jgi:hypothetical protein
MGVRNEVTGDMRKYVLLTRYFIVIKLKMSWAGCAARMGSLEKKRPLKYPGIDGRIILILILKKYYIRAWIGFMWLRIRTIRGLF